MASMRDQTEYKLHKLPFFIGDAMLLGAAFFIYFQSKLPMGAWQILFIVLCVAGGAVLGIMPFLLEYRLALKLAEANALADVVPQIQNVQGVAQQISTATNQWQTVQEQADKTAGLAKQLSERMSAEVKGFTEFMQRSNDTEKANLRLEVEKLRRMETDWLQVSVRMLDHVYALHQGAVRSGAPRLIEQLGHFQTACRDAARRVGLVAFSVATAEPFDAQKHQLVDAEAKAPAGATVAETVASGYTFQGRLIRPALVRLTNGEAKEGAISQTKKTGEADRLPLDRSADALAN
jgi:molecular chaperone GrpE (heat shock protein)